MRIGACVALAGLWFGVLLAAPGRAADAAVPSQAPAAHAATPSEEAPAADTRDCFAREPVRAYLERLQERILQYWVLPEDVAASQDVVVRLRLDEGGMLIGYELVSWGDRRLAQSVLLAVVLSFPFEVMQGETRCLAGRPIVTTLANPP